MDVTLLKLMSSSHFGSENKDFRCTVSDIFHLIVTSECVAVWACENTTQLGSGYSLLKQLSEIIFSCEISLFVWALSELQRIESLVTFVVTGNTYIEENTSFTFVRLFSNSFSLKPIEFMTQQS